MGYAHGWFQEQEEILAPVPADVQRACLNRLHLHPQPKSYDPPGRIASESVKPVGAIVEGRGGVEQRIICGIGAWPAMASSSGTMAAKPRPPGGY